MHAMRSVPVQIVSRAQVLPPLQMDARAALSCLSSAPQSNGHNYFALGEPKQESLANSTILNVSSHLPLAGAPQLHVLGALLCDLRAAEVRIRGSAVTALVALQMPHHKLREWTAVRAPEADDRVRPGERPHRPGRVRRAGEHPRGVAAVDGAVRRLQGAGTADPPAQSLPRPRRSGGRREPAFQR